MKAKRKRQRCLCRLSQQEWGDVMRYYKNFIYCIILSPSLPLSSNDLWIVADAMKIWCGKLSIDENHSSSCRQAFMLKAHF